MKRPVIDCVHEAHRSGNVQGDVSSLLDDVDPEGIVITKRGKPVARLVPFTSDSSDLIGALGDRIQITGDILSTGAGWDAQP